LAAPSAAGEETERNERAAAAAAELFRFLSSFPQAGGEHSILFGTGCPCLCFPLNESALFPETDVSSFGETMAEYFTHAVAPQHPSGAIVACVALRALLRARPNPNESNAMHRFSKAFDWWFDDKSEGKKVQRNILVALRLASESFDVDVALSDASLKLLDKGNILPPFLVYVEASPARLWIFLLDGAIDVLRWFTSEREVGFDYIAQGASVVEVDPLPIHVSLDVRRAFICLQQLEVHDDVLWALSHAAPAFPTGPGDLISPPSRDPHGHVEDLEIPSWQLKRSDIRKALKRFTPPRNFIPASTSQWFRVRMTPETTICDLLQLPSALRREKCVRESREMIEIYLKRVVDTPGSKKRNVGKVDTDDIGKLQTKLMRELVKWKGTSEGVDLICGIINHEVKCEKLLADAEFLAALRQRKCRRRTETKSTAHVLWRQLKVSWSDLFPPSAQK
jgi:hypothetical protein